MTGWTEMGATAALSTDEPETVRAVLMATAYDAPIGLDVLGLDDDEADTGPWHVVAYLRPAPPHRLHRFVLSVRGEGVSARDMAGILNL